MKIELPDDLFTVLREGVPALLLTVDAEGFSHTAFSFVATRVKDSIAVLVDEGSATQKNIERTGTASVQILAEGNRVFLMKGRIQISEKKLAASPVPSRRAVMELAVVKNQAWPEIVVSPMTYNYSPRAMALWAKSVPGIYAELRGE